MPSRVLVAIVDDEESVRTALGRLCRSAGIDVETYPSGAEFLKALGAHSPDCLVLDLHMPGVTGFEVLAQLKALKSRVPVVVITGYDTDETRERVERAGVAAYLLKPVDEQILLSTIRGAVAGSAGARSNSRESIHGTAEGIENGPEMLPPGYSGKGERR